MVEFCDNPKTAAHVNAWRGKKDQTAACLLIKLWRKEEKELGVKRDKHGRIIDTKKPLFTSFQEEQKLCHCLLTVQLLQLWMLLRISEQKFTQCWAN